MEKTHNKLVRNKIPGIIAQNGEGSLIRILDDNEFKIELYKKLLEETKEVINASNEETTIEELADVLEVIKAIAETYDKTLDDVIEKAEEKRTDRGGFDRRIFLEKTYSKDNEKTK